MALLRYQDLCDEILKTKLSDFVTCIWLVLSPKNIYLRFRQRLQRQYLFRYEK